MNQKKLETTLSGVVEDCVNSVGAVSYTHLIIQQNTWKKQSEAF